MAVTVAEPQLARLKFVEPDTSKDPWDCGYVASPEPKEVINEVLPLHDLRPEIFSSSSPYTLRTHGFTAIKHKSVLHSFDNAEDVENIYLPEVKELLKSITGAKSVHVIACDQRRKKAPTLEVDEVRPKGLPCGIDLPIHEMDLSKPRVGGAKSGANFGPARSVHIDYSPKGAGTMIRYNRKDIAAEDEAAALKTEYNGRRYGLFSVWRPLKTVGRDPISVCDPNSIVPKRDLVEFFNKQPGENGDFLGGVHMLRGNYAKEQKWYWIREQRGDEVLVIQFFDSHAKKEGRPVGTPHVSPELMGVGEGDPRESVEARCLALW